MNLHTAPLSPRAAHAGRNTDLKPLDALLASLTAITGVLLATLVLLALFSRHPSIDLLKMLAFLAMVFGGISLAFSRALVQVARSPQRAVARCPMSGPAQLPAARAPKARGHSRSEQRRVS